MSSRVRSIAAAIPAKAGIGLRAAHYQDVLDSLPGVAWLEVHSENYLGAGGRPLHFLERIRSHYPISIHGVGLSLGSTDPLERVHLRKLKSLIERIAPALISEHLSWSSVGGRHFNDLLPLPYTEEALEHVCRRIVEVQAFLGRRILIENPSTYLQYGESSIPKHEFLREVARRTGCGLLLDINNLFVSARNHKLDPWHYLAGLPPRAVQEIHLAGHARRETDSGEILIDTHDAPIADEVWALYARAVERFGPRPTLIEWDSELPPLAVLLEQASCAEAAMQERHALAA